MRCLEKDMRCRKIRIIGVYVKEDEGDARLPAEKEKHAEAEKANQMANEQETRKEERKKLVKERTKNEAIQVICGG